MNTLKSEREGNLFESLGLSATETGYPDVLRGCP